MVEEEATADMMIGSDATTRSDAVFMERSRMVMVEEMKEAERKSQDYLNKRGARSDVGRKVIFKKRQKESLSINPK